jgi:hypothetical protein
MLLQIQPVIYYPMTHEVMGAIGAAMIVHEEIPFFSAGSKFTGFGTSEIKYHTSSFECKSCPNMCEIAQLWRDGKILAQWGGRCELWERTALSQ